MNTFYLIIVIVVILWITIILLKNSYIKGGSKSSEPLPTLYWKVICHIRANEEWIKKELLLESYPYEQLELPFAAEALIEKYMLAMRYNSANGYWIEEIVSISEDQYFNLRKDLFVTLHGYDYEK